MGFSLQEQWVLAAEGDVTWDDSNFVLHFVPKCLGIELESLYRNIWVPTSKKNAEVVPLKNFVFSSENTIILFYWETYFII